MTKTSVFPIDILEFQLSIWISNFILEMAKTISQKLELFPLYVLIQYSQNRISWKFNRNKSSAIWIVANISCEQFLEIILDVPKIKLYFQNINWENRSLGYKLQDFKLTEKCFYNEIPLNL